MTKKQTIQILSLVFLLYVGIYILHSGFGIYMNSWEYGYEEYFVLISSLLLLGFYVMCDQKKNKFMLYFRFFLYLLILIIVFKRLSMYYSIYNYYDIPFETDFLWLKVFKTIFGFFLSFDMFFAILASLVLALNKPVKFITIKIFNKKLNL